MSVHTTTHNPTEEQEAPMEYDSDRDFAWLIIRPWIWVPRLIEIVTTLVMLIIKLWLDRGNPDKEVQKNLANYLLITLTKLGPCFIKVGQALSTRPDLVRRDWLEELTNLQDNLPPFNHTKALQILENELGGKVETLFEYFPNVPIASASLGQVYKARLYNDYWVAVKIQRPNLAFIIRRDVVIIKSLAILSSPFLPLNLGIGLGEIIDEFGRSLFEEINYESEARNAERFSRLFRDNPAVTVPKVEKSLSSFKVITTSWIDGVKLKDVNEIKENHIDPKSIIRTGVISGIQQLLEFGFFHADPHPGNMFALKGKTNELGHLAYIDFGMMDTITSNDRITLTEAIVNLINQDYYSLADDFKKLGFLSSSVSPETIVPALKEVLGGAINEEVVDFNFKKITDSFSELMFDYPFRVPARFALIIRAVVSQEGLALNLDPQFKIVGIAYPYVAKRLLAADSKEMLEILLDVIFDNKGGIRINRIESLLGVLLNDGNKSSEDLIPVAGAGLKLICSKNGKLLRRNLLLSMIKDEKLDTKEIKTLIKLISKTFSPTKVAGNIINRINPLAV